MVNVQIPRPRPSRCPDRRPAFASRLLLGLTALGVLGAACQPSGAITPRTGRVPLASADAPGPPTDEQVDHGMEPAYVGDPDEVLHDVPFPRHGVVLALPEGWAQVEGEPHRWEGASGYVSLNAADPGTGDVRDLCENEARAKMQPYGSDPRVDLVEVDGRVGCVIWPSADQMGEGNHWGALILHAPAPIVLDGIGYPMLVVTTDVPHLATVRDGLRFG